MNSIAVTLPQDITSIEIVPIADLHIGDKHSNLNLIKKIISYVENTPNAYCILNGDILDNAICASVGDTYGEVLSPMKQLQLANDLFGGLVAKGKILGITGGNHERRTYKHTGIDTTMMIAQQWGLLDRYAEEGAVLFLRFGYDGKHGREVSYSIYFTHGTGGGRKEGGKINRLVDLSNIVDTDIYICSHTHLPATLKTSFFRCDYRNNTTTKVDKLFVNTNATLEYGGYGQVNGYRPNCTDVPIIVLDGKHKRMRCII